MSRPRLHLASAFVVALAATATVVALPEAASADTCGDDSPTQFKLFDPVGQYFDFTPGSATPDRDQPFAALYDSGGNGPADTPPGPRSNSDSFDDWGALFVGGTAVSDMYFNADNNSCSNEENGAERVYPVVTLHGLQVQRKIYVQPNSQVGGLPGARILNLLTNTTGAAVTTTVQVGDLLSSDNDGDLGSDDDTAVRSSSSGDPVAAAGDKWFVTSDHANLGGTENSDPALAFVVDGPTGTTSAASIQVGGGADAQPQDNLAWLWQVTLQPGETVALMSFVVQADVATGGTTQAAQADALAASRAQAYLSAPTSQLYAGMSAAEIAALKNWNDLEVKGQIKAAKKQKLRRKFSVTITCPEEACTVDLHGKVKVGSKSFKFKTAHKQLAAGGPTKVALKFKKRVSLQKIKALIANDPRLANKVKVLFTGSVSDLTHTATQPLTAKSRVKV